MRRVFTHVFFPHIIQLTENFADYRIIYAYIVYIDIVIDTSICNRTNDGKFHNVLSCVHAARDLSDNGNSKQ